MRSVEIVEIDFPRCQLTYGVSPCTAALGVTGTIKCFNTARTCQDRENYDEGVATLRFIKPSADPNDYGAIPSLSSITITPAVIEPGLSIGKRETAQIVFEDHPDSDVLTDPYFAERNYDPFTQGTFWGKIRARIPSLRGTKLRIYRGQNGDDIADMDSWTYYIETDEGPSSGRFIVKAKDPLKFLDGDRAQAPTVTPGILDNALTASTGDVVANVAPAGAGDLYYPSSGKVAIGGSEVCAFTRIGDVMTLVRAQSGTDAVAHDQFEGLQLVLEYSGESPADIIYDLLTEYTDVDPLWIPLADWQTEMATYINRLYSAEIAEPTSVQKLVDEIIEQVGLVMWADLTAERINLTALRPVPASATIYTEDRIVEGTFSQKPQLDKRVSQAWTYIGQRNPLAELTDRANYKSVVVKLDETGADAEYGNQPAIKKIYSRWITNTNRTAASRLNDLLLSRYRDPPRRIGYQIWREDVPPSLGRGAQVNHYELQSDTGGPVNLSTQIVSLEATESHFEIESEELDFSIEDDSLIVFIDESGININLRDLYDEIYGAPTVYDKVTFIIESGVVIGTPWRDYNGAALPSEDADLENPDFEEGNVGWTFSGVGSATIDQNGTVYNGTWSATLGLTSNPNGGSGSWTNDARSPISPGEGAAFSCKVFAPGGWGATEDAPFARLSINWYDAGMAFISATHGAPKYGYETFGFWSEIRVVGTAPAGAAFYTVVLAAAYGDGGFYFDQVRNLEDELFAVMVGDWPEGNALCLINNGQIRAGGGRGGHGPDELAQAGINGATGIYTRYAIEIENNGVIAGGGGGGGGWENGLSAAGGGGGAGYSEDGFGNQTFAPGGTGLIPSLNGQPGTVTAGGAGGDSGSFPQNGGGPGEDGQTPSGASAFGAGGQGGNAVDGESYIDWTIEGTILGDRIN